MRDAACQCVIIHQCILKILAAVSSFYLLLALAVSFAARRADSYWQAYLLVWLFIINFCLINILGHALQIVAFFFKNFCALYF
jgi:hypothetical protein